MYENTGGAPPERSLNFEIATGCTQANSHSRSTRPRRKTILGPTQRIEELQGNLEQRRRLQNSWHAPFDGRTTGCKSPRQGQEVDRKARPIGKSALSIAVVEEIQNLRRNQKSSERTTTTSPQSLAMSLRRTAVAVPNMDHLSDKGCTTRPKRCCKKFV